LEELPPKAATPFEQTRSYNPTDAINRLFNGAQVYKVGYNSLKVQTCIVKLSRKCDKLVFKRITNNLNEASYSVSSMVGIVFG
jgi:hypothetical protein